MQVWQRKCPLCYRSLEKQTLEDPWRCECGWTTDETHRKVMYQTQVTHDRD